MTVRRYEAVRQIDAPPGTVWGLLTDPASYRDWNKAVVSIQGEMVEGGTISLVSIVDPDRTFRLTISEFAAPRRMVWTDGMPLGLFRGDRTYRLDAHDGGTAFSMVEVFSGPLAGLVTRFIPDLTASFAQFADSLKAAAERRGAPQPDQGA